MNHRMVRMCILALAVLIGDAVAQRVWSAPPGTVDGRDIPADFGAGSLLATQTNKTGFGDQQLTPGAFVNGSELDALYLANDAAFDLLRIGIAGNLEPDRNHVHIFIGTGTQTGVLGQQDLAFQGVEGPPYCLNDMSRLISVDTNGTPGFFDDDTCVLDPVTTTLPCVADYAISLDTFYGNLSVNEYTLYQDPVAVYECTFGAFADVFATRLFVTQTALDDVFGFATNDQFFGYERIGISNDNYLGVTDTSGATALTATTGIELTVPWSRLGLTGSHTGDVNLLVTLTGADGFHSNQMLPAHPSCTTEAYHPDLSLLGNCLTFAPATLPVWSGGEFDSDGTIDPGHYGGSATAVQDCPTDFGDQHVDAERFAVSAGSELDELFATSDNEYLYLGIPGNLEASGNGLLVFFDSIPGGQGSQSNLLDFPVGESRLFNMTGSRLPIHPDDMTDLDYDYALEINGVVGSHDPADAAIYYADLNNLQTLNPRFLGSNQVNQDAGSFQSGDANSNGFYFSYAFLNNGGVVGCGEFESCDFDSSAAVSALADTATAGFELAIPLADIGIESLPDEVCMFAYVTNFDGGYGSNQALPSLRDPTDSVPTDNVENAGGGPTGPSIDFSNDGDVGFCAVFPPDDFDCQFAYFARAACVQLEGIPVQDCNSNGVPDDQDISGGTSDDCNLNAIPDECESIDPGDCDCDGDVDLGDFAGMPDCLTGPVVASVSGCECFDLDGNGRVDLLDFALFTQLLP